jgi:hypothetical protein
MPGADFVLEAGGKLSGSTTTPVFHIYLVLRGRLGWHEAGRVEAAKIKRSDALNAALVILVHPRVVSAGRYRSTLGTWLNLGRWLLASMRLFE